MKYAIALCLLVGVHHSFPSARIPQQKKPTPQQQPTKGKPDKLKELEEQIKKLKEETENHTRYACTVHNKCTGSAFKAAGKTEAQARAEAIKQCYGGKKTRTQCCGMAQCDIEIT